MPTLADYAEQILTATAVEAKLAPPPGPLGDEPRRVRLPEVPGRPPELSLHRGSRPRLPSPASLSSTEDRAIVLHAMANHELLAVELFALAILRFPEAPRALRRSWLATLRDEQRHVAAYVARLADCGVSFGDWPVSAYFWDALSAVDSPLSFVAGLELGLEQANLDFAGIWARAFRRAGDPATAAVLDEVHADEIRHVRVGVHWLRTLKEPAQSDFDAWTRALRFPLTPARGRGPEVDRAAREAAGLDQAFIDRIAVTSNSRGRDPRIFVFDGALEDDWAGRPQGRATSAIDADLAPVMALLAAADDVVVGPRPHDATLERWQDRGLPVPQFVPTLDPARWPGRGVPEPWGWSPRMRAAMLRVTDEVPEIAHHAPLHQKSWAAGQLAAFADCHPGTVEPRHRGHVATDETGLEHARAAMGADEHWIKAACSAAGRHRVRVPAGPLDEKVARTVRRFLREGPVVVERHLRVLAELSTHVRIDGDVRMLGTTRFGADGSSFRGVVLGSPTLGLPSPLRRALHEGRLGATAEAAARFVGQAAQELGYRGPLSIDALVVDGDPPTLKPIGEVNARYTMGHLGLRARRRLRGDVGFWLFLPRALLSSAGVERLDELVATLPPQAVATTEPATATTVVTLLWSGPRYDEVVAAWRDWLSRLPRGERLAAATEFVEVSAASR